MTATTLAFGSQSMVAPLKRVLLKHARDAFASREQITREWEVLGYVGPPDLDRAIAEYDDFVALLTDDVPHVEFLGPESGPSLDSIYAYDAVIVTEHGTVVCRMGKPMRRCESQITANYLRQQGIPILGCIQAPGILEAGDVVWLDRRTAAVGLGYRTNQEGIRQFRELLAPHDIEVIVVPLPHWNGPGACLHLMGLISLVDRDLAVTYSRALPVFIRDALIARGYDLLDVPDEEHRTLACNVLALSPRRCMMVSGNPVTRRLLERAGATVIEYVGTEISLKGSGGPTCLTRPMLRG